MGSLLRLCPFLVLAAAGAFGCEVCPRGEAAPSPHLAYPARKVYPEIQMVAAEAAVPSLPMPGKVPVHRPLQILTLSGGVAGAPFTAGVLLGWTRTGTRPMFDMVTGISSGALIGAYAFLGSSYDAELQRLILSLNTADLIRFRPLRCMLRDGAFGSAKPAQRLICTAIDDRFVADLRRAHAEGRRFYVGTMGLQTKRLVTWDVGAIASSDRPDSGDLVRKVLLAAISWPGAVPPVDFDVAIEGHSCREQHCDAGSVAMAFLPCQPPYGLSPGSNLYVLASRKLYSEPAEVPKSAFCRLKPSVSAIFEALTRADIARLYSLCALSGMHFHLLAVPADYHGEPPSIANLYPKEARQLFETGYHLGGRGPCWRFTPPGAEPGEDTPPRDGREIQSCHGANSSVPR